MTKGKGSEGSKGGAAPASSPKTTSSKGGSTKMTLEDASRIQSAQDKNPQSASAQSGFKERAQRAAEKNKQ